MAETELAERYRAELAELGFNSKPIITSLTIIAGENVQFAPLIASLVESRILSVRNNSENNKTLLSDAATAPQLEFDKRLPVLYLLDSIIKNIGGAYTELFSRNAAYLFVDTFSRALAAGPAFGEPTRAALLRLLRTWYGIFPAQVMSTIDQHVRALQQQQQQQQRAAVPSAPAPAGYYYTVAPQPGYWVAPAPAPSQPPAAWLAPATTAAASLATTAYPAAPPLSTPPPPQSTTAAVAQQQEEHTEAVWKLYGAFRAQCSTCGLRFSDHEKMAKHMDWHYAVSRATSTSSGTATRAKSRTWMLTKRDWLRQSPAQTEGLNRKQNDTTNKQRNLQQNKTKQSTQQRH